MRRRLQVGSADDGVPELPGSDWTLAYHTWRTPETIDPSWPVVRRGGHRALDDAGRHLDASAEVGDGLGHAQRFAVEVRGDAQLLQIGHDPHDVVGIADADAELDEPTA